MESGMRVSLTKHLPLHLLGSSPSSFFSLLFIIWLFSNYVNNFYAVSHTT